VVGTTPENWVWSGTKEDWVKDWWEMNCHEFLSTSGVQADFQHMIDLNMDLMDISRRIGFDIQMVGEQQCVFMLSDGKNMVDLAPTQVVCLLADKKELIFDTGATVSCTAFVLTLSGWMRM
jgi:hypothetical protein